MNHFRFNRPTRANNYSSSTGYKAFLRLSNSISDSNRSRKRREAKYYAQNQAHGPPSSAEQQISVILLGTRYTLPACYRLRRLLTGDRVLFGQQKFKPEKEIVSGRRWIHEHTHH